MQKSRKNMLTAMLGLFVTMSLTTTNVSAATTNVAVAANFTEAAKEISAAFAQETGHEAILSFGATGQFYTQIVNGAPFEILLAADNKRPALAVAEGHGVDGSPFTYAVGQLVLYTIQDNEELNAEYLQAGNFNKLAIANPDTAPYGLAAVETMNSLDLYEKLKGKIIQGQSIGQTYQFVETGNAEVGFVALGQVAQTKQGSRWIVPTDLYTPIEQDAVLLLKGQDNPAAVEFLEFLKSETARDIITKYGYAVVD